MGAMPPWDDEVRGHAELARPAAATLFCGVKPAGVPPRTPLPSPTAVSRLAAALMSGDGKPSRDALAAMLGAVQDEMEQSRTILHQLVACSQQGMFFYDRDFRLVSWNQAGLDILGLSPDLLKVGATTEQVARLCAERGLYGPGAIDDLVAARVQAIRSMSAVTRTRSKAGDRVFDMRSVRMPDGGVLIINTDVTEQAVTEEKLEAENETLERRVRERTEELERLNAALAKAKAEAEEANISKTRFLAAASHDLLQPLNAARLYATSLKERIRGQAQKDDSLLLAVNVEQSLEAVEDILTTLLDISRLDAGAMKPELSVFRLDDIFSQLTMEFLPVAREKGLYLTFVPSSLPVHSDRRLLRRLLQNLVSNAIKYTSIGRVVVGARRSAEGARIEVWDTGLGIPKAKQSDVFREFERLPDAASAAPGVGLGLSIVQRLSRVLDHEVVVRSKPGRGSVFSVTVPVAAATSLPRNVTALAISAQRSFEGLVIAVIDNETAVLDSLGALLRGWQCSIVAGVDLGTVEAELSARGLTPDVILADYHVGETNGLAAIAALRGKYGPCHAVLVTADRSAEVRGRAIQADARLLHKPLKPAALRALLTQWRLVKRAAS